MNGGPRYVHSNNGGLMPFKEIAARMGGNATAKSIRVEHNKIVKKMRRIMAEYLESRRIDARELAENARASDAERLGNPDADD